MSFRCPSIFALASSPCADSPNRSKMSSRSFPQFLDCQLTRHALKRNKTFRITETFLRGWSLAAGRGERRLCGGSHEQLAKSSAAVSGSPWLGVAGWWYQSEAGGQGEEICFGLANFFEMWVEEVEDFQASGDQTSSAFSQRSLCNSVACETCHRWPQTTGSWP